MNKNNKKIILFLSISVVIMTTLFISIAYSYFVAKIKNNESKSTISVAGGEMIINYQDNTGVITASKIIPSWTTTKKFTVSGKNDTKINDVTTDNNIYYKIVLVIDNNTFSKGALTYSLKQDSSSSTNGQMATNSSGTINQSGKQNLGRGYFSTTSTFVNHIYNLTISFPDTGKDQSIDNAKSFAGHVTIEENNVPTPTTFAEDPWSTIAAVIKDGQLDAYSVGDEKEVEIGGKSYTVRVANNTTPAECSGNDFSQTACGFVVEFVDIIENRTTGLTNENSNTYANSEIRTYLNNDFYNKLPSDLRKNIIKTNVISLTGTFAQALPQDITYGNSIDYIYLISEAEITGENILYRLPFTKTRQLDYYLSLNYNSSTNTSYAIKKFNNVDSEWWLRDRLVYVTSYDYDLSTSTSSGEITHYNSLNNSYGIAPAFRIG